MLNKILKLFRNPVRINAVVLSRISRWSNMPFFLRVKLTTGSKMKIVLPDTLSTVVLYEGDYESKITDFLKKYLKEGNVFFDVGAHFGLRTLQALDITKGRVKVFAFEPGESQIQILKDNTKKLKQVEIVEKAVSSISNKVLNMQMFGYRFIGSSTLEEARLPDNLLEKALMNFKVVKVKTISIDDFCKAKKVIPNLIKIDVENHEYEVLKGAIKILKKFHPKIVVETNNKECHKLLNELGYKIIRLDNDNIGAI